MDASRELEILIDQYQIVQKSQQDANSRLFQTWVAFGAITTASVALLATGRNQLATLAPFGFLLWFCIFGIVNYDIQYRAIFLAFLEQQINSRVNSSTSTLIYESFASARMWKQRLARGPFGLPVSLLWILVGLAGIVTLYVGISIFALLSLPQGNPQIALLAGYTLPLVVIAMLMTWIGPRQLQRFKEELLRSNIAANTFDTIT